ncbi:MAG: SLC13/DASS family transporter [Gammaproteobacteria bacterium]|nr:SLC13/DASS family transporter [Gammaproteobacteria bacterium]
MDVPPAHTPHRKYLIAVAAFTLSILCYFLLPQPEPIRAGLAIFLLAGILWLTEAIHITFTALLIPVMAVLFQVMPVKQAFTDFANPVIFLFLGGFALAAALARHGIDRAIGQAVLKVAGTHPVRAAYLLFAATGFISMWISNTATVAMMLPIALGIASRFHDPDHRTTLFLLLGTAYSASIGGMATLVGSPPNAIAASSQQITFAQWMGFGLPAALLLLPLMVGLLQFLLKPAFELQAVDTRQQMTPASRAEIHSGQRNTTLLIFLAVVSCWIFSTPLSALTGVSKDFDAWVAVMAIVLLGATGAIQWEDVEKKTGWGILLLFGGGMTLSSVLDQTGTSAFIAGQLKTLLGAAPTLVAIMVIAAFVVFLTELVSNTACAALLIPLLVPVAAHFGVQPVVIAVLVAIASSAAFMLPVATPPNAIVFGTGLVPQRTMMRCGFYLNLMCIGVLTALAWLLWI